MDSPGPSLGIAMQHIQVSLLSSCDADAGWSDVPRNNMPRLYEATYQWLCLPDTVSYNECAYLETTLN